MWNDKKPWWQRKSKENQTDKTHYKDWCVIHIARFENRLNTFAPVIVIEYKACPKLNVPVIYNAEGKLEECVSVSNLTKAEAYAVAKGLNFFDGQND